VFAALERGVVAVVYLDEMVLRVHPGNGIVARSEGVVLAVMAPDTGQDPLVDEILLVVEACASQPSLPGRSLSRRLAGLIAQAEPDEVPSFAAIAQVEGGLAILVHGSVEVTLSGPEGSQTLSGRQAASWVDRIVETPVDAVVVGGAGEAAAANLRTNLRAGVVPGGGLSLVAAGTPVEDPAVASEIPGAAVVAVASATAAPELPAMGSDAAAASYPAAAFPAALDDAPADQSDMPERATEPEEPDIAVDPEAADVPEIAVEPDAAQDPVGAGRTTVSPEAAAAEVSELEADGDAEPSEAAEVSEGDEEATGPVIKGVICARGHFGDPSAAYCAVCGTSMDHRTLNLVDGNRPSLGALVFDDGTTATVDGDYVLGREPERDEAVVAGRARPLMVTADDLEISRIHAGLVLDGWDATIVDLDSANGTFISTPADTTWTRLIPHIPVVLSGGTSVRMGQRTILFDSPSGP